MNEVDALDLVREAFWTIIISSGPAVAAAMIVGVPLPCSRLSHRCRK